MFTIFTTKLLLKYCLLYFSLNSFSPVNLQYFHYITMKILVPKSVSFTLVFLLFYLSTCSVLFYLGWQSATRGLDPYVQSAEPLNPLVSLCLGKDQRESNLNPETCRTGKIVHESETQTLSRPLRICPM